MALPSFNCENICKDIYDSWGKPNHLIQLLVSPSQLECRKIRETYLRIYGVDPVHLLLQRNKDSSQGNEAGSLFSEKTLVGLSMLMLSPHERDAVVAREAFEQGDSVNYKPLLEIFLCRKSSHVLLIQEAYYARFKKQLEQDIISIDPSHPYQRILMALCASHKALQTDVSQYIANFDARRLYKTGDENRGSVDEAVVLEILSKRSIPQLRLTFSSYKHIYGHSYVHSLKKEKSGEFEDALRVAVKCMSNPTKYYAEIMYECIKGTRIDKDAVIRVILSRAEMDMDEIQRAFKKKYGLELKNAISESEAPGDYRELLIALATKTATPSASSLRYSEPSSLLD
ncbi:OLC1v1033934C1 [Oldenlandia corymbosa var. corymbosa]|uniref:OLC1v1033934C1 n=1 Tax=Oldenlandia corymbosa var. corymbosa TaxID=529605 RepID=A0AAV1CPJ3_OLDCO|nr:OLC1v1033934C1 [Oldenlandia corymbosa var. corymbosa]